MNGQEQNIAISLSGLMQLNLTRESAWEMIKESDYCVNCDQRIVYQHLDRILTGEDVPIQKSSDLPEELFKL